MEVNLRALPTTDSEVIGKLTSVIMASTETTFYTIAVYYSGTGIKDIRRVLPCAIFGDLICIVIACIIVL